MTKITFFFSFSRQWLVRHWDKVLYLVILGIFFLFIPGQNIYTLPLWTGQSLLRPLPFAMPTPAPYPVNITGVYPGGEISALGIVVFDLVSGVYLFKRNETQPLSPASTTKLMTALVALESYDLDEAVTVKTVANTGQVIGLVPGERISVENLLFGMLVQSGNDAAYGLAEHYTGGAEAFVAEMNKKAKAIGLDQSTFANSVGYDDPNHKITPLDLTRLAVVALENKTIAKMVAIPQITVSDVTHTYFHPLKNINQLLGKIPGVGGIKTGWTEESGENLVTLIERGGRRVIIVVLKSRDRFRETAALIDWAFANYQWKVFTPNNAL